MATKGKKSSGSETATTGLLRKQQPKVVAVGPAKAELVEQFSPGKIPLGGDFEGLIEVADIGRKAVGLSPDQTSAATGAGLELDGEGKLNVRPASPNSGLNVTDGVQVGAGNGITVSGTAVSVKADTSRGIAVDANGVRASISEHTLQYSGGAIRVKYMASIGDKNYLHYGLAAVSLNPGDAGPYVLGVKHDDTLIVNNPLSSSQGNLGVNPAAEGGLASITTAGKKGLGIKLTDSSGLQLGDRGLSVRAGAGLSADANGLKVGQGTCITVSDTTVSVKVKNGGGLDVTADGLAVSAGTGVPVAGNGIAVSGSTISVKPRPTKSGLDVTSAGVNVRLTTNGADGYDNRQGLHIDPNGVLGIYIEDDFTITNVGSLQLNRSRIFARGMIMMFNGSSPPPGWSLCNGTNNTPDLRDKFILGGTWTDVGYAGGTAMSGDRSSKSFTVTTDPATEEQGTDDPGNARMFADDGHRHTVKITPPYYILAFIMKD